MQTLLKKNSEPGRCACIVMYMRIHVCANAAILIHFMQIPAYSTCIQITKDSDLDELCEHSFYYCIWQFPDSRMRMHIYQALFRRRDRSRRRVTLRASRHKTPLLVLLPSCPFRCAKIACTCQLSNCLPSPPKSTAHRMSEFGFV